MNEKAVLEVSPGRKETVFGNIDGIESEVRQAISKLNGDYVYAAEQEEAHVQRYSDGDFDFVLVLKGAFSTMIKVLRAKPLPELSEPSGTVPCVKFIVTEWLKERGYGALAREDNCGCGLDDLCPCGGDWSDCVPAYAVPKTCLNCDLGSEYCDNYDKLQRGECYTTKPPKGQS